MTATVKTLQIEGIDAQTMLSRFESLEKQLDYLRSQVAPQPKTVFLTREEVAEYLKVSLSTVWIWTKQGILKPYRLGNQVRYVESEVVSAATAAGKGVVKK